MKRILSMACIIAMVLSLCNVAAFAEDTDTITITTGAEFKTYFVTANFGKTFVIAGEETLADGSKGIIIPDNYSPVSSFYGSITGVDGKNNIQTSKQLIYTATSASGAVTVENIVLKSTSASVSGVNSNGGSGASILIGQLSAGTNAITLKNITNYVNIIAEGNTNAYKNVYAGGILGYAKVAATIENCINYGSVTQNASTNYSAGGIVGGTEKQLTIKNCKNYGAVTSTGGGAAGILGHGHTSNTGTTITNCANHGNIVSESTQTNRGAAGIAGTYATISNTYNAGNVTGTNFASGILGLTLTTDCSVINCFNAGTITSKATETYYASGIAGYSSAANVTVTSCYNTGAVSGGVSSYKIGSGKNFVSTNNYYVSDTNSGEINGTPITLKELAKALPTGFTSVEDAGVWTYTTDESYNYSLPQISGNEFVNTLNNNWYIAAAEEPTLAESVSYASYEGTVYDEENEEITDYAIVVTKFEVPESAASFTYGMLLHEENVDFNAENASAIAPASKNVGGAYGILFYGNRFVNGNTYYVRPYVEIDGTYTLGEISSFVFSAE